MNFDDRELNKQKKKTEKKKITSSNSFLAFLRSHHTVYRNFFLQYSSLFLCLYDDGLVCLHFARSESSDTANKAFSVSNLILEVSGCRRFTLASNKTLFNSFRQSDKWLLCSMQQSVRTAVA